MFLREALKKICYEIPGGNSEKICYAVPVAETLKKIGYAIPAAIFDFIDIGVMKC